jgi:hypothetical protein
VVSLLLPAALLAEHLVLELRLQVIAREPRSSVASKRASLPANGLTKSSASEELRNLKQKVNAGQRGAN